MEKLFIAHPYENSKTLSDQASQWVYDRFGPSTAVVDKPIAGRSDSLGVITYQGGQYSKATTYEPVVIPVGSRVRVLGRVRDTNILVVVPLTQISSTPTPTPTPNPDWAVAYIQNKKNDQQVVG